MRKAKKIMRILKKVIITPFMIILCILIGIFGGIWVGSVEALNMVWKEEILNHKIKKLVKEISTKWDKPDKITSNEPLNNLN